MPPRISYCTACKGRVSHLKECLPESTRQNPELDIEFVLVDYDCPEGTAHWARQELGEHLDSGRLRLMQIFDQPLFHMARSKNTSHRRAKGEILINLDADNVATEVFTRHVRQRFEKGVDVLHFFDRGNFGGGCGRLAIRAAVYNAVGGYDEQMHDWGFDDLDLWKRCEAMGYVVECGKLHLVEFIRHNDQQRTQYTGTTDKMSSLSHARRIHHNNMRQGNYVANAGRSWGFLPPSFA